MNTEPEHPQEHAEHPAKETWVADPIHYGRDEEVVERRKEGYWRRIGGGSLAVSIAVHGLIVLLALVLIWRTAIPGTEDPPPDFIPGGGGGGGGEKMAVKRMKAVTQAQPKLRLASPAASSIRLPDTTTQLTDLSALTATVSGGGGLGSGKGLGRGTGSGTGVGSGIGSGFGPGSGAGFISLPKIMRSRCSPAERASKMRENGGSDACEVAVKKSLDWLKTKQNADGSWGATNKGGMTGLALLCYLGHCETPDSPAYGENVLKGINYLLELGQKNNDAFSGIFSTKPSTPSSTYEHGIAAYALGEMYSFAKLGNKPLPGLREGFEKGTLIIISKQQKEGSWGYKEGIGYDEYGRNDLSVTGWQFQALKAAHHTSLKIPGLEKAMKRVEKYLEGTQTKDGGFGDPTKTNHYNQWNLSGAAVLGLETTGGNASKISRGIKFMLDDLKENPLSWNADCYLYTWYYNTQAFFQKGGDPWKQWNDQFQPLILENQNADGSYKAEGVGEVGASGTGAAGGDADIYRTTLCTLMLEVYYRYLKVGDRNSASVLDR